MLAGTAPWLAICALLLHVAVTVGAWPITHRCLRWSWADDASGQDVQGIHRLKRAIRLVLKGDKLLRVKELLQGWDMQEMDEWSARAIGPATPRDGIYVSLGPEGYTVIL